MARASCSLNLSLLHSDEIILTFSQKYEKSSGAFHTTTAFSITLYVKSDLVHFGTGTVQNNISYHHFFSHVSTLGFPALMHIGNKHLAPFIHQTLFNMFNITFALQITINIRYI